MCRFTRSLRSIVLAFIACTAAASAADNPELSARLGATEKAAPLAIGKLDIAVVITGDTAHTVVTAEFLNPSAFVIEGEFVFDLPRHSVVTGYALDVNGKMIDGVLVGERQARLTYEKAVRRGVDPGLGEVTRTGAFKTHVFPILPGKGRTVRLAFDTPIEPGRPFVLPLHTSHAVGALTYHLTSPDQGLNLQGPTSAAWAAKRSGSGIVAEGGAKNQPLTGDLIVTDIPTPPLLLARHASGEVFFEIGDAVSPSPKATAAPDRVRIYWDSSLSRRDADLKNEIALIGRYIAAAHPAHVDLVFFAAGKPQLRSFNAPKAEEIEAVLKVTDYQGGTSIKSLFAADLPAADVCLLFSDGNVTADSWKSARAPCLLFTVASVRDANRPLLTVLAEQSGGAFVDLSAAAPDAALQKLLRQTPRVADVRSSDGSAVDYAVLPVEGNRIRVVGKLPEHGNLVVKLSRSLEASRRYTINRDAIKDADTLGSLWALHHIDEMLAGEHLDRDAVVAFSRRYSVASPQVSFVVFENLSDYVAADVEPPVALGKDMVEKFHALKAEAAERKATAERERLDQIVKLWDEEKRWWVKLEKPESTKGATVTVTGYRNSAAAAPPPPPAPSSLETVTTQDIGRFPDANAAAALQRVAGVSVAQGPMIDVQIADWKSDRPYIKALEAAKPETYWYVYRDQEKASGNLPAFYLDVAEFMFRKGRAADAVRIVLNALELPSADVTTMTIVADRLMRYGDTARAVWLYERILFLEPDRPQPKRNLALALAARGEQATDRAAKIADLRQALDLYNDIVIHDWRSEYNGIEVISLMEANRIVAKLAALGVSDSPLDKRLVALLDVDLRIVMEWNTDQTDMDLWVDEPTGERAIYSHKKTRIGGRLSNDMTHGYGPEEYLLHKAPNGSYTVRVNVFATDRLNPNGATTVRAHIFRNYGRASEQEQVLEIELSKADKDAHVIGTIKVAGSKVKPD
jgi:hypothetical protein